MTDALTISLCPDTSQKLDNAAPALLAATRKLCDGISVDDLPRLQQDIHKLEGLDGVARFLNLMRTAARSRGLRYATGPATEPLATLMPLSSDFQLCPPLESNVATHYQLSRFAFLRRDGDHMLLESPAGLANIRLSASAVELVTRFATAQPLPDSPTREVSALFRLLISSKALIPLHADDPNLATWEFHDLLFHTRSRNGRASGKQGGTYRFLGQRTPLPALPTVTGDAISLPRPDLEKIAQHDAPFTSVLEQRHSSRAHGAESITLAQLGEFLFRAARVRSVSKYTVISGDRKEHVTATERVYPSGGRSYELDLYLTVARCTGLEPGLYYYDPVGHALLRRTPLTAAAEHLLSDARSAIGAMGEELFPQVLITYAARFQRVNWKYEGIAYALILKHVGALQQTMYLVAEAMKLAGCAIGSGNADLFARAAGTDYAFCTSVGEFTLGSQAPDAPKDRYAADRTRVLWQEPESAGEGTPC